MKKTILLFVLVVFAGYAEAQLVSPVKWSYAAKKLSSSEAEVYLKATIDKGWHIYSTKQKEGGPIKTSISFGRNAGYSLFGTLNEPKAASKYEKTFGMQVLYFESSALFRQKIRLRGTGVVVVKGKVEFMVCNDHECLPPSEVEFSIPVK